MRVHVLGVLGRLLHDLLYLLLLLILLMRLAVDRVGARLAVFGTPRGTRRVSAQHLQVMND